ncbi:g10810 [Coccomyxa elongata]
MKLSSIRAAAQQILGPGKLVTKTEIPAFIPRQDLMDQLVRWAVAEADEPRGLGMWGLPVKVEPYYKDEDVLWGITFTILRDGEVATQLGVWYDDEEVRKHEWVGRGADGFPTLEGKESDVVGKHLEIRKLDENPVDDVLRETIRNICQQLVAAINKYYAFGSAFVDDAT